MKLKLHQNLNKHLLCRFIQIVYIPSIVFLSYRSHILWPGLDRILKSNLDLHLQKFVLIL